MDEHNSDYLYGDLESASKTAEIVRLNEQLAVEAQNNKKLTDELNAANQQIETLVNERTQLEINMTALYNTAVAELKRKDRDIQQLKSAKDSKNNIDGSRY